MTSKISPTQKIALIAAMNNGGVLSRETSWETKEALRYFGLIKQEPEHRPDVMDKRIAQAWKDLRAAAVAKDAQKAADAVGIIRGERYDRERMAWKITQAGQDLLLNGQVSVTLGKQSPRLVKKTA